MTGNDEDRNDDAKVVTGSSDADMAFEESDESSEDADDSDESVSSSPSDDSEIGSVRIPRSIQKTLR